MVVSAIEGVRTRPTGLPRYTLAPQIIGWASKRITQPDGPEAGEPFKLTDEQVHFLCWWYAVDETGRFVYRRGMLRRMKGWGKDPFGAYICIVELLGPCRFERWVTLRDGSRAAYGAPHAAAWVQTAATSKDQTRNTMTLFPGMISDPMKHEFDVDMGKEIIYARGGRCRLEAVTSSPTALEGQRSTFVLKNETHLWFSSNDGHAMAEVIARNLAKSRGGAARSLAISNAHEPGQDSDAERDFEVYEKITRGETRASGFLYDSLEAPPFITLSDPESLRAGLLAARGDSDWLDIDGLMDEIYDPKTRPSTARRFYLNQIVAEEDDWLSRQEWDACAAPRDFEDGEMIALGFDGSKSNDHTGLVACAISDGHVKPLGRWDPESYRTGVVPQKEVDAMVERAFEKYDVVAFLGDVREFETYIDIWEEDFGEDLCVKSNSHHDIAFDMRLRNKEFTLAAEAFYDAVVERDITHDGEPVFSSYFYNAKRAANNYGTSVRKETPNSDRKIDLAVCAILARYARQLYLGLPENKQRAKRGISVYVSGDD